MEQNKYGAAITYEYEQNLYINMTNQCCNSCDLLPAQQQRRQPVRGQPVVPERRAHQGGDLGRALPPTI